MQLELQQLCKQFPDLIATTGVLKSKDKVKLTDLSVLLSIFIEYFVSDTVLEKHYHKITESLKEYSVSGMN